MALEACLVMGMKNVSDDLCINLVLNYQRVACLGVFFELMPTQPKCEPEAIVLAHLYSMKRIRPLKLRWFQKTLELAKKRRQFKTQRVQSTKSKSQLCLSA